MFYIHSTLYAVTVMQDWINDFFQLTVSPPESPPLSKCESDSQNFVLVGSIGASVVVLLLTAIIIVQCVILIQWKKTTCRVRESKINHAMQCKTMLNTTLSHYIAAVDVLCLSVFSSWSMLVVQCVYEMIFWCNNNTMVILCFRKWGKWKHVFL